MMKRDIIEYKEGSFIDFEGKEHKLVACAVSMSPEKTDGFELKVGWVGDDMYVDDCATICNSVKRVVVVAIAVCNPCDEFDLEKGKKVAYNKAINNTGSLPTLYADQHGVISKAIVETFLTQELLYAQNNPEKLIKGYLEAKTKYETVKEFEQEIASLSQPEIAIIEMLASNEADKYQRLANILKSRV